MEKGREELMTLASKRLQQAIRFPLCAYCDVHDLLASVLDDWSIDVFRVANAQVAFTVRRKDEECEVTALRWKPDGSYLAVSWSDGTYVLYSGESGRLISQANIRAEDQDDDWRLDLKPDFGQDDDGSNITNVKCFGWSIQEGGRDRKDISRTPLTTDDWYTHVEVEDHGDADAVPSARVKVLDVLSETDRSRSNTFIDANKVLPRLSAIPAHQMPFSKAGPGGNKFASQTTTDSIFPLPKDIHSHLVQAFFVCQDDGAVQVLLDETVKIGTCRVDGKPLLHMSHPQNSVHSIISENVNSQVDVNLIDLPLPTLSGPLLHMVSTNTKRIQNLLDYIAHSVRCIEHDFTTGQQKPTRLLNSLSGSLDEKEAGTAVYNLYHLAMTGDFTPVMIEWLVDIVKETQHKLWDQSINNMYTNIHNHIFMNILPAIDRISIAIDILRKLAKSQDTSNQLAVPPQVFDDLLDAVDSMRIVAQKMQLVVMTEHKQFRNFSKWLRIYIDIGTAEPFSRSAMEIEERELPSLDYSLILAYIKDTMTQSKLIFYIQPRPGMSGSLNQADFFNNPIISKMSYGRSLSAMKLFNEDESIELEDVPDPKSLLNLPSITATLLGRARVTLQHITKWQSRMLPSSTIIPVPIRCDQIIDTASTPNSNMFLTLSSESATHHLSIVVISPPVPTPVFLTVSLSSTDENYQVLDAKFQSLAPPILLVLMQLSDVSSVVMHHTTEPQRSVFQHTFERSFKGEKLLIGGRKGKKVCVVFGNGGKEWRALAIDGTNASSEGKAPAVAAVTVDDEWEDEDAAMEDDSYI